MISLSGLRDKLKEWYDLIPTWLPSLVLLFYYPNLFLDGIIRESWLSRAKEQSPSSLSLLVPTLLITLPSLYLLLSRYSLLAFSKNRAWIFSGGTPERRCTCISGSSTCEIHSNPVKFPTTNPITGLSGDEVLARQRIYPPHEIWKPRSWLLWALQFNLQAAQILIFSSGILALLFHEWRHVPPICLLWVLQARFSAYQQKEGDDVVEGLLADLPQSAIVLRDGRLSEIPMRDLVPGDIVHVAEGTTVPADGRVVVFEDLLQIDVAIITGDHTPVSQSYSDMCYWGSVVIEGDAFLQIEYTGLQTFIGGIITLVQGATKGQDKKQLLSSTEFTTVMQSIGFTLFTLLAFPISFRHTATRFDNSWITVIALVADMALFTGACFSNTAVTTIRTQASATLTEPGCIPQDINAPETFASTDILIVDAQGILVDDRATLVRSYCVSCEPEDLIFAASLSDPSEDVKYAIVKALKQYPQAKSRYDQCKIVDTQESKSQQDDFYKYSVIENSDSTRSFYTMGAPRPIYNLCHGDTDADPPPDEEYIETCRNFTRQGFIALGVAKRSEEGEWQLLGLLIFCLIPRENTSSAFKAAGDLGMSIKVASELGTITTEKILEAAGLVPSPLSSEVITELIKKDELDDLATQISNANVLTEIYPSLKLDILNALQNSGYRVAITGSSVSDTTMLRKADVGIASTYSTEKAQSASDLTFLDRAPGLLPMIDALRFSRQIFQRAHDYVVCRAVRTLHTAFIMIMAFMLTGNLLNMQPILFCFNITDILVMMYARDTAGTPYPRKPVRWSRRKILRDVAPLVGVLATSTYLCISSVPLKQQLPALTLLVLLGNLILDFPLLYHPHVAGRNLGLAYVRENLKLFGANLALCLLATLVCMTGWIGESLNLEVWTAVRVWVFGGVSLVTCVAVKRVVDAEELMAAPSDPS